MARQHAHGAEFIEFINETQQAYESRRLEDYLASFSPDYCTVQLHTGFHEDLDQLGAKIAADIQKYDLLSMQFSILDHWFTGETAYAHMSYLTRLRHKDSQRVLIDERQNLIVANHLGAGAWAIVAKITLSADNYFESER
ncbi:hypothetical protein JW859_00100 [bacterium]|nr:hypothetical protein [bacterium]